MEEYSLRTLSLERGEHHQHKHGADAPDKCKEGKKTLQFGFLERVRMFAERCYFAVLQWLWQGHAGVGRSGGIPNGARSPSHSLGGG